MFKKILFILIIVSSLIVNFPIDRFEIKSSPVTASLKGFNINGFDYEQDITSNTVVISTEDNEYGNIRLWSAIYSCYYQSYDLMVYALLISADIQSNTFNNAIKNFANRKMIFEVNFNSSLPYYEASYPDNKNYTGSYSISISASLGYSESGVNASVGFTYTYYLNDISLVKTLSGNGVTFDFDFTRYADNDVSGAAPYAGLYTQDAVVFYSIYNYSYEDLSDLELSISYTGYIFKDHWLNNVTKSETINNTYKYNEATKKFY